MPGHPLLPAGTGAPESAWSLQRPQEQWREVITHVDESPGDVFALTGQLEEAREAWQASLAKVPIHDHIRQAYLHQPVGFVFTENKVFLSRLSLRLLLWNLDTLNRRTIHR